MILKKPYAFLIKHFKLIHVILVLLMSYLLYHTNLVLDFFQQYISSNQLITGKDFTEELFNIWMFAIPFIIGTILLIVLGVMYYKKKPFLFYVFNILLMIAVLVFYNIGYNMAGILETKVVELRTLRLVRDLYVIIILIQGLGLILTFIRATGFDIKKFDFGQDLEELEITDDDNEEFELDVDLETNVLKREIKRKIRFSKYFYVENKFVINILILIVFSVGCFAIYSNLTIYNKSYDQNEYFMANDYTIAINNSYLTNENYRGNKITNNHLLVLELDIQANYFNKSAFNTTKAELKIGKNIYHPINNIKSDLIDLGNIYNGTVISQSTFEKILLVYEIPKDVKKKKMFFNYIDSMNFNKRGLNPKYIKVKLTPKELDIENKIINTNLNEVRKLNPKFFKESTIYLTNFEINNRFKINYKFCDKNKCYNFSEYLNPILNTNYDKVLLKIEGILNMGFDSKYIYDLYTLIKNFGKIKYEIDGNVQYYTNIKNIVPTKTSLENTLYLEIPNEVMDADKISLVIDIRDEIYEFAIK